MKLFIFIGIILLVDTTALAQGDLRAAGRVEVPMPGRVVDLKLADSRIACLLTGGDVRILDRSGGKLIAEIKGAELPATSVAISRDGDWLAVVRAREMVPSSFGFIATPAHGPASKAAFGRQSFQDRPNEIAERGLYFDPPRPAPNNDRIPRIPYGGVVTIRRISDEGSARSRSDFPENIAALEVDGSSVTIVGSDMKYIITDNNLNVIYYFSGDTPRYHNIYPHQTLIFDPDRKSFACLVDNPGGRIDVAFFDAKIRRCITLTRPPDSLPPWAIAISPDGRKLAACGPGNTVTLWDLEGEFRGRIIRDDRAESRKCSYILFAGNSRQLITCDDGGGGRLWDIETDRVAAKFQVEKRDIRAASYFDGLLTLVSGAYRYRGAAIEPLTIQQIRVAP